MYAHLDEARRDGLERTEKLLEGHQDVEDPRALSLLFAEDAAHAHTYQAMANEVTVEYKTGMLDPSRTVGKAERKAGAVRKRIAETKRRFARMSKID